MEKGNTECDCLREHEHSVELGNLTETCMSEKACFCCAAKLSKKKMYVSEKAYFCSAAKLPKKFTITEISSDNGIVVHLQHKSEC